MTYKLQTIDQTMTQNYILPTTNYRSQAAGHEPKEPYELNEPLPCAITTNTPISQGLPRAMTGNGSISRGHEPHELLPRAITTNAPISRGHEPKERNEPRTANSDVGH